MGKKLNPGYWVAQQSNSVGVCKWKDKRGMITISNIHKIQMVPTENRKGEEKEKPNIVAEYNQFMSGIDRLDQRISQNSSLHKSLRW